MMKLIGVVASVAPPGVVTKETVEKYSHHEYDGFLYVKQDCKTCLVRKVPRSKHCRCVFLTGCWMDLMIYMRVI